MMMKMKSHVLYIYHWHWVGTGVCALTRGGRCGKLVPYKNSMDIEH